jgi:hypothetical protein
MAGRDLSECMPAHCSWRCHDHNFRSFGGHLPIPCIRENIREFLYCFGPGLFSSGAPSSPSSLRAIVRSIVPSIHDGSAPANMLSWPPGAARRASIEIGGLTPASDFFLEPFAGAADVVTILVALTVPSWSLSPAPSLSCFVAIRVRRSAARPVGCESTGWTLLNGSVTSVPRSALRTLAILA